MHSVADCADDTARVLGPSPHARALRERVRVVAEGNGPILISGETGTGKEVVARAVHCATWADSTTASLVVLGCGALPEDCLCRVLQIKGGGACPDCRAAHLRAADVGGTLLLDEIGELSPLGQEALLAFLDTSARGADGNRPMLVIATSNQNLRDRVAQGVFRDDLYARLAASEIAVPSLRDRVADIPVLLGHMIEEANHAFGTGVQGIAPQALRKALGYSWPGNVRELKNVVLQAVLMARNGRLDDISLDASELAVSTPDSGRKKNDQ
jgi:DNA-binding NtrC family response regulator